MPEPHDHGRNLIQTRQNVFVRQLIDMVDVGCIDDPQVNPQPRGSLRMMMENGPNADCGHYEKEGFK
jgi:hypothetical protein